MEKLKHWYYLLIANTIEKAYTNPKYMAGGEGGRDFLCHVIWSWFPPLTWLTRRYIMKNLSSHTLVAHLRKTYGPRSYGMNKAFWVCVVKRIRVFKDYSGFGRITISDIILEDTRLNTN